MANLGTSPSTRSIPTVKRMVFLGILTAIAYVVTTLCEVFPNVGGFLSFEFKDAVICIGAFLFGPMAGAIVGLLTATIEMVTYSQTGPIGLLMNVLSTCAFCCTASFIYQRNRTQKGAINGLASGMIAMTTVMLLWNYLITPVYMNVPRETVVGMLVPLLLPFNLVKSGINAGITLVLYKPIVTALRSANLLPPSQGNEQETRINMGFLLFSMTVLLTFVLLALVLMGIL